ncbi:dihydrolipoamide acetyltransferase family protein [Geobacillus sp. BK01]|uniref:dihydrolipoamide acetyltransferase family protein n=1 Tax=Geobacillus sp. BK01 TaxID=3457328 RepID=UPI003FA53145
MAVEIIMPKLGMSMEEGTVIEWLKKKGDPVKKGESVVVISSDKIEKDIEAPQDGVLLEIVVEQDGTAKVGNVIGYIGEQGEGINKAVKEAATAVMKEESEAASKHMRRVSPAARKLAREAGVDLRDVVGTGPKGRVTRADIEKAIQLKQQSLVNNNQPAPSHIESASHPQQIDSGKRELFQRDAFPLQREGVTVKPVTGMRKVIASRMFSSLQQTAQLTVHMRADVTKLVDLQEKLKDEWQDEPNTKWTVTDFIARAAILALQAHKQMNSLYRDGCVYTYDSIHLGIAVALEKGLVVPVIRHAEQLSLKELSQKVKECSVKARNGELSNEEMTGSTFTITSLGAYGVEFFTPVLNPPEVAILGVGTVTDIAVFEGDVIQRRKSLPLSLTFDHQVVDGAPASEFLGTIKRYLENPYKLLW